MRNKKRAAVIFSIVFCISILFANDHCASFERHKEVRQATKGKEKTYDMGCKKEEDIISLIAGSKEDTKKMQILISSNKSGAKISIRNSSLYFDKDAKLEETRDWDIPLEKKKWDAIKKIVEETIKCDRDYDFDAKMGKITLKEFVVQYHIEYYFNGKYCYERIEEEGSSFYFKKDHRKRSEANHPGLNMVYEILEIVQTKYDEYKKRKK